MKIDQVARQVQFGIRKKWFELHLIVSLILQFIKICSFLTIIHSVSSASFYKAKILHAQNRVLTSGLQSFLLSSSYNAHQMSNPIKGRKLQFYLP